MKSKLLRARAGALASAAALAWLSGVSPAMAQSAPSLGAAQSYAVLAGTTVTNTGPSVISGDVGVSPGAAVVGFPPGIVNNGSIHAADANAGNAQTSLTTAYNDLQGQPSAVNLTGQDLGGLVLTPAVYTFATSAQLTGVLTLNGLGNPGAVFVFQIGSTLTTASNSSVLFINGASPCNVFWAVGSSATLGTNTSFVGNIVALTSITLNTGATVQGRTLARNGAVTLDNNTVSTAACAAGVGAGPGCPSGSAPTISAIPDQIIPIVSGSIGVGFTIGGPVVANALRVTVASANPTLVPQSAMVVTAGPGGSRSLSITGADGRSGVTTITITVTDPVSGCSTSRAFQLAIGPTAVPTLPEWAMIALALALAGGGIVAVRRRAL